jgi:Ser/Thr protein kinase RdoA (MazF antagonist)
LTLKITLDQVKKLLALYKLKVVKMQPMEHGFFVDTSKGMKKLTVWDNADLLRWSNNWREKLAEQGYTHVERFLYNQNQKKYIRYKGKIFVLSDVPEGRSPEARKEEDCFSVGEVFARLHLSLDRIDHGTSLTSLSFLDEGFFTNGSTWIKQVIQSIESKEKPTLVDEVIYSNLPLLYKRFRRAHQLWEDTKDAVPYFPLSFSTFQLNQIRWTNQGWFIHGGYNVPVTVLHHDTTKLIREIYEQSGWNLYAVSAFLQGYEGHRKFTDHELVYILAQLAVPWEVWTYFQEYWKNKDLSDRQAEELVQAILRQRHWDELTIQVARFIDHHNMASA